MSDHNLTPAEQEHYHAYAAACERDPTLAAEVLVATRAEREAWEGAVRATVNVPPGPLFNTVIAAYVAWQRAELREWERLS